MLSCRIDRKRDSNGLFGWIYNKIDSLSVQFPRINKVIAFGIGFDDFKACLAAKSWLCFTELYAFFYKGFEFEVLLVFLPNHAVSAAWIVFTGHADFLAVKNARTSFR
nr:unnamed protein product [Bacillus sp.] [Bacillus sp. (in: firmicutes)]